MNKVVYNEAEKVVEFYRSFTNVKRPIRHDIKLLTMDHTYMGLLQRDNEQMKQPLQDKIEWLHTKKQVTVPVNGNQIELEAVVDLLIKYSEVFACEGNDLGKFPHPVGIPTTGEARWVKQHPIPKQYQSVIDNEIETMLTKGVIEPCPNPYGFNTPVFVVPKKDGRPRVVANYKNSLNRVLSSAADMAWQMPACDSTINDIGKGNKYFSTLDMDAGYWQCELIKSDRYKTAFHWNNKCYQYTRLPFGLKCSGHIFSRCVAKSMEEVTNTENVKTYIDDVLCYGATFQVYFNTLEQVLAASATNGMRLNPKKCTFLKETAHFLGRIITHDGYKADPEYAQGIRDMPPPTTRKELQAVIGRIVWLRMFVETRIGERIRTHCFSQLLSELNKLNRRDAAFEWTREANDAYEVVKKRLSTTPVIHFADFTKPFVLVTDASETACGAVLLQEHNGNQVPVAVASKTLDSVQQRWSATERECFGVVWAIEKMEYFLRGRPFLVLTDHKSLTFVDRTNFNNNKISRWQERLSQFDFVVEYIEGQKNIFADLLSRPCGVKKAKQKSDSEVAGKFYSVGKKGLQIYVPSWCVENPPDMKIISKLETVQLAHCFTAHPTLDLAKENKLIHSLEIAEMQKDDPFLSRVIQSLVHEGKGIGKGLEVDMDETDHRGILYKKHAQNFVLDPVSKALLYDNRGNMQFVVPQHAYPHFLYRAHDNLGHFAKERTLDFLRDFWWPGKRDDVCNYCDSCSECAMRKGPYNRFGKVQTGHLLRGERPFEVLFCDFVHMKSSTTGKRYIFTVFDAFSRYFFAVPTNRDRAIDAAQSLLKDVILKFNFVPKVLSSDRGTHFTSEVMSELCKQLDIKQNLHTAWHPESSGNVERAHRTMKNALYATCAEKRCDWVIALPFVINAMNMAVNKSTKCSPYECVFGQKPNFGFPTPTGKNMKSAEPLSYGLNVRLLLEGVHRYAKTAAEATDLAMEMRQKKHKLQHVEINDEVYVKREHSVVAKVTKLPWTGPYRITDTNQHVIKISDGKGNSDWIHRNHIFKRVERKPELERPGGTVPPPISLDSEGLVPARVSTDSPVGSAGQNSRGQREKSLAPPSQPEVKKKAKEKTISTVSVRPTRTKTAPDRLNISNTTAKTYAQAVRRQSST